MLAADSKAKRVTGTGSLATGRARIAGVNVLVSNAGAGRLTITDGNGGATLLDLDFGANASDHVVTGGDGILASTDIYISAATNITGVTVFYH